ncbi:MAG: hypothetical protein AB7F31_04290 [Parachlamydiales bacterium]
MESAPLVSQEGPKEPEKPNLALGDYEIPHDLAMQVLLRYVDNFHLPALWNVSTATRKFCEWIMKHAPERFGPTGMPELIPFVIGTNGFERMAGRLPVCGMARDQALALYGTQRRRYEWACRLGGRREWQRNELINEVRDVTAGLTLGLGGIMALNIIGRSLLNRSFTHVKTQWKRYLFWLAVPPAIGIARVWTLHWANEQLAKVPLDPHSSLSFGSVASDLQVGAYGMMDRDQFVLASVLKALGERLDKEDQAAIEKAKSEEEKEVMRQVNECEREPRQNLLEKAYREGCYRIHCKGLIAQGNQLPDWNQFTLDQMRFKY